MEDLFVDKSFRSKKREGENNIKLFICTLQDTAMFTCSKYFTFSETARRLNTECIIYILYLLGTFIQKIYLQQGLFGDTNIFFTEELCGNVFEYKCDKLVKIFF